MRLAVPLLLIAALSGCASTDCSKCPPREVKVACWDPPERQAKPPRPTLELAALTLEVVQENYAVIWRAATGDLAALMEYAALLEHEYDAFWGAAEASELPSCPTD
jgi:hypothetical protein